MATGYACTMYIKAEQRHKPDDEVKGEAGGVDSACVGWGPGARRRGAAGSGHCVPVDPTKIFIHVWMSMKDRSGWR